MAAADELRRSVGSALATLADVHVFHQECEQRVQEALGKDELDTLEQRGRSMTFEEAVDYALAS